MPISRSRAIWLREGRLLPGHNRNTAYLPDVQPGPCFFKERFTRHHDHLRELLAHCTRPGVVVTAVDERGVAGAAFLAADPDRVTSMVIGRHSMADLHLEDPALSLRHALLLLHPARSAAEVRFRVVDLRTALAFRDERGRQLEAFEAEGPAVVSCARYALFVLPTASAELLPEESESSWDCLPARVTFDEELAEPDRWQREARRPRAPADDLPLRRGATLFRLEGGRRWSELLAEPGPVALGRSLVREGEEPAGELEIESERGAVRVRVGGRALRRGILLGRAARCDGPHDTVLATGHISRVHLLVIEHAGRVHAVDTASTCGVSSAATGAPVRMEALAYGAELVLGQGNAHVRWRAVH